MLDTRIKPQRNNKKLNNYLESGIQWKMRESQIAKYRKGDARDHLFRSYFVNHMI